MDTARVLYSESLEIKIKLAEQLNTQQFQSDISFSLEKIGDIEVAKGDLDTARTQFAESFEIIRKLAKQINMPANINQKIWVLQKLAYVQILLEENQAGFNLLKENESDVDELQSKCSGDVGILDTVAAYWERRTEAEEKLKMPEAKTSKAKAEAIRNEIENKKSK